MASGSVPCGCSLWLVIPNKKTGENRSKKDWLTDSLTLETKLRKFAFVMALLWFLFHLFFLFSPAVIRLKSSMHFYSTFLVFSFYFCCCVLHVIILFWIFCSFHGVIIFFPIWLFFALVSSFIINIFSLSFLFAFLRQFVLAYHYILAFTAFFIFSELIFFIRLFSASVLCPVSTPLISRSIPRLFIIILWFFRVVFMILSLSSSTPFYFALFLPFRPAGRGRAGEGRKEGKGGGKGNL